MVHLSNSNLTIKNLIYKKDTNKGHKNQEKILVLLHQI